MLRIEKKVNGWYKRYQEDCEVIEDLRFGRLSTSTTQENMEKAKEIIMNDRRIITRKKTIKKTSE